MGTNMGDGTQYQTWIDSMPESDVVSMLVDITNWKIYPMRTETAKRNQDALRFIDLLSRGEVQLCDVRNWLKKLGDSAASAAEIGVYFGRHSHG
jgi:hypothetical protein